MLLLHMAHAFSIGDVFVLGSFEETASKKHSGVSIPAGGAAGMKPQYHGYSRSECGGPTYESFVSLSHSATILTCGGPPAPQDLYALLKRRGSFEPVAVGLSK